MKDDKRTALLKKYDYLSTIFTELKDKKFRLSTLKQRVAEFYGLSAYDLDSKSRRGELVKARHIYVSIAFLVTNNSLTGIAKDLNGRDHATIIHNIDFVDGGLEFDSAYRSEYESVLRYLLIGDLTLENVSDYFGYSLSELTDLKGLYFDVDMYEFYSLIFRFYKAGVTDLSMFCKLNVLGVKISLV